MKKLIITSLLTSLFTTAAFAGLPSITFEGKKITVEDTRASLIKKLGKPTNGDSTYSYWKKSNYSISAGYNQYGLKDFGISQLRTTPTANLIVVGDTKLYLGKDSLKSAVAKLKHGCFDLVDNKFDSTYSLFVMVQRVKSTWD